MNIEITLPVHKKLKNALIILLPKVKSSHRVEALARGLGYRTNAALLNELKTTSIISISDDRKFIDYLNNHGFPEIVFDTLSEAIILALYPEARQIIKNILAKEPTLSLFGFGVPQAYRKTQHELAKELGELRKKSFSTDCVLQFILCNNYLKTAAKR